MSEPLPPIFITSGVGITSGTSAIPLWFETPGPNLEILWTHNGDTPLSGTIWTSGQTIPYNSWIYENTNITSAAVFVQAIMRDTTTDEYSSIAVQDYIFYCSDPIITQTATLNLSCLSPNSILYYYAGELTTFDLNTSIVTSASNPSSLSLSNGKYVFFSSTEDGLIVNRNIIETDVNLSVETLDSPIIAIKSLMGELYIDVLTIPVGSNCYYTTNGDTPTILSTLYTSPFLVTTNSTIKVICIRGASESNIKTEVIKTKEEYALKSLSSNLPIRLSSNTNLVIGIKSFVIKI